MFDEVEQEREVDLTRSRLVAARGVCELHVPDASQIALDGRREISFEPRLGCGLETIEKAQLTLEHGEVCGELRHGTLTLIVRISAEKVRQ